MEKNEKKPAHRPKKWSLDTETISIRVPVQIKAELKNELSQWVEYRAQRYLSDTGDSVESVESVESRDGENG